MPFATRGGVRLHYRVSGHGPFVALQHALTNDHRAFEITALRKALVDAGFRCVTMDAVGHGKSQIPDEPGRYALQEQAADLLSVMDGAGAPDFLLYGYSMGAWIATGAIAMSGARIRNAVIGGWDPIDGARLFTRSADDREARAIEFEGTIKKLFAARGSDGPPPAQLRAFQCCYQALFDDLPPLHQLARSGADISFLCGASDPYRPNVERAAEILNSSCAIVPGNHVAAFVSPEAGEFVKNRFGRR